MGYCGEILGGIDKFKCMELPLRDIKYIIGPCIFYFFKCGSRNIYLFGERHHPLDRTAIKSGMNNSNTIFFPGFVYSLIKQNPTINYDLMFESPFFFEKGQTKYSQFQLSTSPTISSIYNTFYDCINPDTRASLCMYKNLRTHYIDYRFTVDGKKIMAMPRGPEQSAEIRKLVSTGKVGKQIAAIKDVLIRTVLKEYATRAIYEEQTTSPVNSVTVLMDIYGIARMLREFDSTTYKHNSQFKGTPQNIIYYAGAYHIDSMRDFFTNYLGLTEGSIKASREPGECDSFLKLDVESLQNMVRTMPDTVPNP